MSEINNTHWTPQTNETDGDYTLIQKLGAGGMGEVWLAEQASLHRKVAIKFILSGHKNPDVHERLKVEAISAAKLNHPNIIQILSTIMFKGTPAVVMEYIEGHTLKDLMKSGKYFSLNDIFRIAEQVAKGLGAAEKHNVIHRDIKPANLLIMEDGHLKILDFGLARIGNDPSLTKEGTVMGTAHYMSPEQAAGKTVNSKSDFYSLGILLYELLEGQLPFHSNNPLAVMKAHLEDDVPPMSTQHVPEALQYLVMRLLDKRPEKRPSDSNVLLNNINVSRRACCHNSKMEEPIYHSRSLELKLYQAASRTLSNPKRDWVPENKAVYTSIALLLFVISLFFLSKANPPQILHLPVLPPNSRLIFTFNHSDKDEIIEAPFSTTLELNNDITHITIESEFYYSKKFKVDRHLPHKSDMMLQPDESLIKKNMMGILEQDSSKEVDWTFLDNIYGNNPPEKIKFLRTETNRLRSAKQKLKENNTEEAIRILESLEYSNTQLVTRRFLRQARILLIPDKVIQLRLTELQQLIREGKHDQARRVISFITERRPNLDTDFYLQEIDDSRKYRLLVNRLFLNHLNPDLEQIKKYLDQWGKLAPEDGQYIGLKKRYEHKKREIYLDQQSKQLSTDLDIKSRSWNPWAFHQHLVELNQNKRHSDILNPYILSSEKKMATIFCRNIETVFNAKDSVEYNKKHKLFDSTPFLEEQFKELTQLKKINWKDFNISITLIQHGWKDNTLTCTSLVRSQGRWTDVVPPQTLDHSVTLKFYVRLTTKKDSISLEKNPPLNLISCERIKP